MRIGEVIGNVTLSRAHPTLAGGRLLVTVPLSLGFLATGSGPRGEPVVVYDELGAGRGSRIGFTDGREASQPFYPDRKPLDAYNACILDRVDVDKPIAGRSRRTLKQSSD